MATDLASDIVRLHRPKIAVVRVASATVDRVPVHVVQLVVHGVHLLACPLGAQRVLAAR